MDGTDAVCELGRGGEAVRGDYDGCVVGFEGRGGGGGGGGGGRGKGDGAVEVVGDCVEEETEVAVEPVVRREGWLEGVLCCLFGGGGGRG